MMKKCHSCQVEKPLSDYLVYASGKRAGRVASVCTKCWKNDPAYPPRTCKGCGEVRPVCDFDRQAAKGKTCKVCLMDKPEAYRKVCTECGISRKVADFSRQTKTSYRFPVCKRCDTKHTIEKNRQRPQVVSRRRKLHTAKTKSEAYLAYGGAHCACCGETELTFLTLDHIENDGAEWRRATFGGNGGRGCGINTYMWCKRNKYPPIFQVLCWNCQQGKRYNGGTCPHQRKTCNDYPQVGVESSDSKRFGSAAASTAVDGS